MDVFDLRHRVIDQYSDYVGSFVTMRDQRIREHVEGELRSGALWPQPLIQLNPAFEPGDSVESLVAAKELHPKCLEIFRDKPTPGEDRGLPAFTAIEATGERRWRRYRLGAVKDRSRHERGGW